MYTQQRQRITNATLFNQYYYDVRVETLSAAVIAQADVYAGKCGASAEVLKIFVRKDEIMPEDDFGDLNVTQLIKGLQPKHYQIAVLEREPKILKGVRVSV